MERVASDPRDVLRSACWPMRAGLSTPDIASSKPPVCHPLGGFRHFLEGDCSGVV
jgi:hypothetical protein